MDKKKLGYVMAYREGHNNYGTSLQGFVLLKKLQEFGFDVEIIVYEKHLSLVQKVRFIINAIRCGEFKDLIDRVKNKVVLRLFPNYANGVKKRTEAVNLFKREKFFPFLHKYVGYNSLHEGSKNYSVFVVGSDQVWTPMSLPNKYFNLLFVDDKVPKVSYASSFGVSEIPNFQKKATGAYLDRYKSIGVREKRGKEIVDSISNQIAQVVADPTMLFTREEWEKEILNARPHEIEPYIFCYFLGTNQDARSSVNKLKEKTGYKIITIRHMDEYVPKDEGFGDEAPYYVDPLDFVKYVSGATYVCTDSFHCSVFSIIFHRQFMTFYRYAKSCKTGRNSRIDSLFNVLGINKDHLFVGGDICNNINSELCWNTIDENLKNLRLKSLDYLKNALK
ncbi:MAG: polysaccharide pyruvyl transferase family protein [Prevotella sp.]|nr:polysaccharide pyruvyl transferase family protein [Prevotella sp.]